MRLRVICQPWCPLEFRFVVQEQRAVSTQHNEWCWLASYACREDAEDDAEMRMKGPIVLKEYDDSPHLGAGSIPAA